MTLRHALESMRRWRSVVGAGILIGAVVGWVSAPGTASATTFRATQTLILKPGAGSALQLSTIGLLAMRGSVPSRVATRLGIDRQRLESMVSAETPTNTGLLLVTGSSTDRAQAEALANVTAEELIGQLGGPTKSPLETLEP